MTIQTPVAAGDIVARVTDIDGFARILEPQCGAVVLARAMPKDVAAWWAALPPDALPTGRIVLPVEAVPATITHLCDIAEVPVGPERTWLEDDVAQLAEAFAAVTDASHLRLRLQAVTTNACRKFHLDALTVRLVCTYRGRGTQFGTVQGDADPEQITECATGQPILLRGTDLPTEPDAHLRHRSPPIEGTGETRLVLVLDPIFDFEVNER
ncbi:MAG: DUF1826 domain-containing protein [Shimia sp.]